MLRCKICRAPFLDKKVLVDHVLARHRRQTQTFRNKSTESDNDASIIETFALMELANALQESAVPDSSSAVDSGFSGSGGDFSGGGSDGGW